MKKAAIITFHASHNYGSMLQAYALQRTVENIGIDCDIINLRTERQRDLYTVFTHRKGAKYIIKNLSHFVYYNPLTKKYNNFENFISSNMKLTENEYKTLEELQNANLQYDYYISGSDQIWNPVPADFDWSYYLPFVKNGKRIAYAPSFGQLSSIGNEETSEKIKQCLKDYDSIAVREKGSRENVSKLTGKSVDIVLDPTLLVSAEEWDKLLPKKRSVDGEYIFLYTLFATPEIMTIAKYFSKKLGIPVVTSNFSNQIDVFNPFVKRYASGPSEFLDLVKNAKLVLASSFHGTVFSAIYKKPFFSVGGSKDARISTLLDILHLSERSIDIDDYMNKIDNSFDIDYGNSEIDKEIEHSMNYLKGALEVGDMQ